MYRWMALFALLSVWGCGGRSALVGLDAGTPANGSTPRADGAVEPEPFCTGLYQVAHATLALDEDIKWGPRIAYRDGELAVVWHEQSPFISSTAGELRFAQVDPRGKVRTPYGVNLGPSEGLMRAALVTTADGLAVLHRRSTPTGAAGMELLHLGPMGEVEQALQFPGSYGAGALARHPAGLALFLADRAAPELAVMDRTGFITKPVPLMTNEVVSHLWLAPRGGGFAAGWFTENGNSSLLLLDQGFNLQEQHGVGHGQLLEVAPAFAVRPEGFAALYPVQSGALEVELYDAAGRPVEHHTLSEGPVAPEPPALLWSGAQLVAVYPVAKPERIMAQLLDRQGRPVGDAVQVGAFGAGHSPTAQSISAVWGEGLLGVATVGTTAATMESYVTVTVMACR